MRVLALDMSLTATGVADESGTRTISVKSTGVRRLWELREAVMSQAHTDPNSFDNWGCNGPGYFCDHVDLVAIEGYSYASKFQAHQLGELGGVIRVALYEAGIPFVEVSPGSVKTYGCGKGNASKEDMLLAAVRRFGYEGGSKDEADALQLYALVKDALGEPVVAVPAAHRKPVAAVATLIEAAGVAVLA